MIRRFFLLWVLLLTALVAQSQTIFNCTNFTATGVCGASVHAGTQAFFVEGAATFPTAPGPVNLIPSGTTHNQGLLLSQSLINIQAFSTTYTFVGSGQNISFMIEAQDNNACCDGPNFSGGAGCEGGFYQAFSTGAPPNRMFATMLDQYDDIVAGGANFSGSSTQWYQPGQSPCNPNDSGPDYWGTNKILTSPVPLNSPATNRGVPSSDTFSVNITYDGSNLTENLFDVTAGGSCPGSTCFTHTWTNVMIPSQVGGNTAWIGIISSTGDTVAYSAILKSWVYTVNTPSSTPSTVAYNASAVYALGTNSPPSPTFSVAPGSYAGTQNVSLTSAGSNYICYVLQASGQPAFYPMPTNNNTSSNSNVACQKGTQYTGPIAISSTATLYATAGFNLGGGPYSPMAAGTYTIGGGPPTASTPTFSPVAGTYTGTQTVTASSTSGCASSMYLGTTSPPTTNQSTISVASSETIYAYVHNCPGFTDSAIASAAYVIDVGAATPTFSPVAGTYPTSQSVTLSTTSGGAIICYNTTGSPATNGSTGCATGTKYTGAISVTSSETLYAVAGGTGFTDSSVGSADYTILPPGAVAPTFSPVAGTYSSAQSVTLSTTSSAAHICSTNDGTTPSTNGAAGCNHGTLYSGPLSVATNQTIKAVAGGTGYADSSVSSAAYVIQAVTPAFSPVGGVYPSAQSISIVTTFGTLICYNSTGSPASNGSGACAAGSTLYTGPVAITSSQTLYAVAAGNGLTDSAVASASYTITTPTPQPTFAPAAGAYVMPISVVISTPVSGTYTVQACYTVNTSCSPVSPQTGSQYTCPATGPCTVTPVNPAATEMICAVSTAVGFSASTPPACALYTKASTGGATGDGRGVQPQPSFPTTCSTFQATKTVATSTSLNIDPYNPTCTGGAGANNLGCTGGTSWEPTSETLDNTAFQAFLNAHSCTEVIAGSGSNQVGLVLGPWTLPTGTTLVVDAGITLFGSRNPADYNNGGTCGTLLSSGNGINGSNCKPWITGNSTNGSAIMGYGSLDERAHDVFTSNATCVNQGASSGTFCGFYYNTVAAFCNGHSSTESNSDGIPTCSSYNSGTYRAFSSPPEMLLLNNANNFTMYKITLAHQAGFGVQWGGSNSGSPCNTSGFTAWGVKLVAPFYTDNTDTLDLINGVCNFTIANSYLSNGDDTTDPKSTTSGYATSNGSFLNIYKYSGLGMSIGSGTGGGITNMLYNNIFCSGPFGGGTVNSSRDTCLKIKSTDGSGVAGSVNTISYNNVYIQNEGQAIDVTPYYGCPTSIGTFTNLAYNNVTMAGANPGTLTILGYNSSNKTIASFSNFTAPSGTLATPGSAKCSQSGSGNVYGTWTYGPNPVSANIKTALNAGTGSTVASDTSCTSGCVSPYSATAQPIVGELLMQVGSLTNLQTYTSASPTQAITLQAVIQPGSDWPSTMESLGLTQAVAFYDNGTLITTCSGSQAIGANGTLSQCPITAPTGAHTYTARYSGDSGYPGVTYNFGNVSLSVGSVSPQIIGPINFTGTVVIQ